MDPNDLGFIKGAIAFALIAATGLTVYWLRVRARFLAQQDTPALDRVHEELIQSRADLEARLLEVEERLDFAERRYIRELPSPKPSSTPKELTPV